MNEDDKTLLVEVDQRAKSNTHQIKDIKDRLDKLENKTEDIHKIATNIEVLCNDIGYIKNGQNDLNTKVDKLSDKLDLQGKEIRNEVENKISKIQNQVDELHDEPYDEYKKTKHDVKVNVFSKVLSGICIALISILITLLASGAIKF